jgi:hypothetical protein
MTGKLYDKIKLASDYEIPVELPHDLEIPQPWGMIVKGDAITRYFARDIAILNARHDLYGRSNSVALGIMQPNAFHRPYIRHATPLTIVVDKWCVRAYKVIQGSFSCV